MDRLVTLKSNRYGLGIYMDAEVSFDILMKSMEEKFRKAAKFFQSAQMAVQFSGRQLDFMQEQQILDLIARTTDIEVVCIIDNETCGEMAYKSIVEQTLSNIHKRDGQFYRGTLKKKQVVESDTSIVILGDVELGAAVVAKGNIVVIGALQGIAHAGAAGDRDAYVVALSMKPHALRIGDVEARRQRIYQEGLAIRGAKIATIDGNRIYVDSLAEWANENE